MEIENIKDSNKHHLIHYFVLILGILFFSIVFFVFKNNLQTQMLVAFLGSFFYSAWGISHHAAEGRLSKTVILEYILISLFVFALIVTALTL